MIGETYRQKLIRGLFGSYRSALAPRTFWLAWKDGDDLSSRVRVENTDDVWAPTGDGVSNAVDIDGGVAGDWTIRSVALYDRQVGGEAVVELAVDPPVEVTLGAMLTIPAGQMVIGVAA